MLDEQRWLATLDELRLECDRMTRVVSALLHRDGVPHVTLVGTLSVETVGRIPLHHWVELADGRRIDLRARMWLGNDVRVPHGIVVPSNRTATYVGQRTELSTSPLVFWALAGLGAEAFGPAHFLRCASTERAG